MAFAQFMEAWKHPNSVYIIQTFVVFTFCRWNRRRRGRSGSFDRDGSNLCTLQASWTSSIAISAWRIVGSTISASRYRTHRGLKFILMSFSMDLLVLIAKILKSQKFSMPSINLFPPLFHCTCHAFSCTSKN